MKEVILFIIIVFLNGCSPKTGRFEYYRSKGEKKEVIQMDLRKNKFVYKSEVSNDNLILVGDIRKKENEKNLTLIFPEDAEAEKLGPFKKGYFELVKIDSSDHIELKLISVDLKYDFIPLDYLNISILSTVDSIGVKKYTSNLIQIDSSTEGKMLKVLGRGSYYDLEFEIPEIGKYEVNLHFQQKETLSFYETTTNGCFLVTSRPELYTYPHKVENDTIKSFGIEEKSANLFILKE